MSEEAVYASLALLSAVRCRSQLGGHNWFGALVLLVTWEMGVLYVDGILMIQRTTVYRI